MSNKIDSTLSERGSNYGTFEMNAEMAQELKSIVREYDSMYEDNNLRAIHKEAIDMIMHKISRIVNGDPSYQDSWVDIQGYAKLAEEYNDGIVRT